MFSEGINEVKKENLHFKNKLPGWRKIGNNDYRLWSQTTKLESYFSYSDVVDLEKVVNFKFSHLYNGNIRTIFVSVSWYVHKQVSMSIAISVDLDRWENKYVHIYICAHEYISTRTCNAYTQTHAYTSPILKAWPKFDVQKCFLLYYASCVPP